MHVVQQAIACGLYSGLAANVRKADDAIPAGMKAGVELRQNAPRPCVNYQKLEHMDLHSIWLDGAGRGKGGSVRGGIPR
jgi:hypothetical protein